MKKDLFKQFKNGIFKMDAKCNWLVYGNMFEIYDKDFNFKEHYQLSEKNAMKIKDILGDNKNIFTSLTDDILHLEDGYNIIKIKKYEIENMDIPNIKTDTQINLGKNAMQYAYRLLTQIKSNSKIDIGKYVGFMNNYIFRTDSYQLGNYTVSHICDKQLSLHENIIKLLEIINDDKIKIDYSEDDIKIETNDYIIIARNYNLPNLNSVLSQKSYGYNKLTFNKKDLENLLKSCDKIAIDDVESKHSIKMNNYKKDIIFTSKNADMEIEKKLNTINEIDKNKIVINVGFNITFVLNYIKNTLDKKDENIDIFYSNGSSLLYCTKDNYDYIFMPIALR